MRAVTLYVCDVGGKITITGTSYGMLWRRYFTRYWVMMPWGGYGACHWITRLWLWRDCTRTMLGAGGTAQPSTTQKSETYFFLYFYLVLHCRIVYELQFHSDWLLLYIILLISQLQCKKIYQFFSSNTDNSYQCLKKNPILNLHKIVSMTSTHCNGLSSEPWHISTLTSPL